MEAARDMIRSKGKKPTAVKAPPTKATKPEKQVVFKETVGKDDLKQLDAVVAYAAKIALPTNIKDLIAKAQEIAPLLKVTDPAYNELGHRATTKTFIPKQAPIDKWMLDLVNGKFALDHKSLAALLNCRKAVNTNGKVPTLKAWCDKVIIHMAHFTGKDTKVSFVQSSLAHQYDAATRKRIAGHIKGIAEVVRTSVMAARKQLKEVPAGV